MAYTITTADLSIYASVGGALLRSYDLYTATGEFAFGELLQLDIELTSSSPFAVNSQFLFNPCLFAAVPFTVPLPSREGWVLSYNGTSVGVQFVLANPAAQLIEPNWVCTASKTSATAIKLSLLFYATQDQFEYNNSSGVNNFNLLQTANIGGGLMQIGAPSVYTNFAYLEFLVVEVDANLNPKLSGGGDPYFRNLTQPFEKQNSFKVAGAFVDNSMLNLQRYFGGGLFYNNLTSVKVQAGGVALITDISRRPFPTLSAYNDDNLPAAIVDNQVMDMLMIGVRNTVELKFRIDRFIPDTIVLKLFRVDAGALQSVQNFVVEYEIKATQIPFSDPSFYPNFIGATPFSTPVGVVQLGDNLTITIQLDASQLVAGASYRIMTSLSEAAGGLFSSHLTPPLRNILQAPPSIGISGTIVSYNNSYSGDDVVMTTFARHRNAITLDASSYTALGFLNDLSGVKMNAYYDNILLENASYNFTLGASLSANLPIDLDINGTDYTFSYQSRLPYNGTLGNKTLKVVWSVYFDYPDTFGSIQRVTYDYIQYIRVRPLNSTRITAMTFLDYTDWLVSIITPVRSLCDDNPLVVVRVTKSGAPNANLAALAIVGDAQGGTNSPTIYEAQSYVTTVPAPLGLAQSSTIIIPQVEAAFGDDFADFIIDTRLLPANNLFNAIGAIIYDI